MPLLLDRYEQQSFREVAWWLDRMRHEGLQALRETMQSVGEAGAMEWQQLNERAVQSLLVQPPRKRAAMLDRCDTKERHLLLLSGGYVLRCGYAWLQIASSAAVDPSVDVHPLTMLLRASRAAQDLHQNWPTVWPFDDDDL